jgi:hypothetical protein
LARAPAAASIGVVKFSFVIDPRSKTLNQILMLERHQRHASCGKLRDAGHRHP